VPGRLHVGGNALVRQLREFHGAGAGDDGQALVEYALILMLVALVAVPILGAIGVDLAAKFADVSSAL
jgi:Flp pilus assembly pilin Flp